MGILDLLKEDYLVLDTRQTDLRLYKGKVPTLRTGRHGILYVKNGKFRKLSGLESLLLQGFPKKLAEKTKGKIADVYLLSQAGNAMTVSVIQAVGNFLNCHNSVRGQLFPWQLFQRHHRNIAGSKNICQLSQRRFFRINDVISKRNSDRLSVDFFGGL